MKQNNILIYIFLFLVLVIIWYIIFMGSSIYINQCLKSKYYENFGNEYGVFSDKDGFKYGNKETVGKGKCLDPECLSENIDLSYQGEGSGASVTNMLWRSSGPCVTKENKYGVYFGGDSSKCISLDDLNKKMEEAGEKVSDTDLPSPTGFGELGTPEITEPKLPDTDFPTDCFPTDSDFDALCRMKNGMEYGLIEKVDCVAEGMAKAKCGKGYVDGKQMPGNLTPCLDNSTDFNSLCPYFISLADIPEGNTYNTVGVKSILPGKAGGCYQPNGNGQLVPDPTKSRAICSTNYVDTLPKLDPIYQYQVKNTFTDCLTIDSNFTNVCKDLLGINYTDTLATEIEGYDCKPGYARAKCFDLKDKEDVHLKSDTKAFLENIKKFQPS